MTLNIFDRMVSIHLFGAPMDWSIRNIQQQKDFDGMGVDPDIFETICFFAGKTKRIFAPIPSKFNAIIAKESDFSQHILLPQKFKILRGAHADGAILKKEGDAFFITSADCPTIIAVGDKTMICAHAGRDSLVDRILVLTGKPSRKHNSVVDAIMEKFLKTGEKTRSIKVFITCGIKAENFRHPIKHPHYGEKNKILIKHLLEKYGNDCLKGKPEEGFVSLEYLIKKQFTLHGVPPENLRADYIDTFSDKYYSGEYIWHSCARSRTEKEKKERNGVLVIRNF